MSVSESEGGEARPVEKNDGSHVRSACGRPTLAKALPQPPHLAGQNRRAAAPPRAHAPGRRRYVHHGLRFCGHPGARGEIGARRSAPRASTRAVPVPIARPMMCTHDVGGGARHIARGRPPSREMCTPQGGRMWRPPRRHPAPPQPHALRPTHPCSTIQAINGAIGLASTLAFAVFRNRSWARKFYGTREGGEVRV